MFLDKRTAGTGHLRQLVTMFDKPRQLGIDVALDKRRDIDDGLVGLLADQVIVLGFGTRNSDKALGILRVYSA